jgi:MFS family permease
MADVRFMGADQLAGAGVAWLASLATAALASTTPGIANSWILSSWSLVGAIGGGFVSVLISRDWNVATHSRERAARWLASSITGFLATPGVMRHFAIDVEPDLIMGVAGAISFVAWGALKLGQAAFNRWLTKRLEQLAGEDTKPEEKS